MHDLFLWYLAVQVLGLACLPLAGLAFANLPDRGWALAKPMGILLLGVLCWLPLILVPALPYSRGWIVAMALLLVAGNVALVVARPAVGRDLLAFIRARWPYILTVEALFAGALWVMGSLRAVYPLIQGTEKFMDMAFVSAIMRAQHLPPPDPWYAGQPINYYYFGHFLIATLAKLLGTPPQIAFNTAIALTAGLAALAIGGVAANLAAVILGREGGPRLNLAAPFGAFAAVAALVFGNLRSFLLWWALLPNPKPGAAWNWLTHPALWQGYDWWTPSRAIPYTITEFPDFSFLLADLHAHVLALPYAVLALGVGLNLWRLPAQRGLAALGGPMTAIPTVAVAGLTLGGLYFMNGWDLPTYLGIALLALALHQFAAHDRRVDGAALRGFLALAGVVLAVAIVPYLPFWLTFVSPGQGIGIVTGLASGQALPLTFPASLLPASDPGTRTFIGDEVAIFGLPLFILLSWLLVLAARQMRWLLAQAPEWRAAPAAVDAAGPPLVGLVAVPGALALHVTDEAPASDAPATDVSPAETPAAAMRRSRLAPTPAPDASLFPPWLPALLVVGGGALALALLTALTPRWQDWTLVWSGVVAVVALWAAIAAVLRGEPEDQATVFPLLLLATGAALIGVCEVVYLKDVFAGSLPRMNTVFKFYFQAWAIFAVAGAGALAWLADRALHRLPAIVAAWQPAAFVWRGLWALGLLTLVAMSLVFPLGASHAIYPAGQTFAAGQHSGATSALDGYAVGQPNVDPGDVAAIAWLQANVSGSPVIVEANSSQADYSAVFARISTFTGLPTIMGWQGHEYQWRVGQLKNAAFSADFSARLGAIQTIYTSGDRAAVVALLHRYHVGYVYVGTLERQTYGTAPHFAAFAQYLPLAYAAQGVMIYRVPDSTPGA